jgi:hypothetical protein
MIDVFHMKTIKLSCRSNLYKNLIDCQIRGSDYLLYSADMAIFKHYLYPVWVIG